MKSFRQFILERNRENKQKKDALKDENQVSRVDPGDRKDVWTKTSYIGGDWGSAPRVGPNADKNIGDDTPAGKVKAVTEPVVFATPGKPNALYAFPRRNSEGKITTAMSVTTPNKKGIILTTPEGEETLKQSKPVQISTASSKGFRGYHHFLGDDERVSSDYIADKKTTIVKNPEKFVKSQFDVRSTSKSGEPYTTEKISKIAQRYGRMLQNRGNTTTSITYQDDMPSKDPQKG